MRTVILLMSVMLVAYSRPLLHAQIAGPNSAGVSFGHINLNAKDKAAADTFWVALGGKAGSHVTLTYVTFPGALVVTRQAEPTGPAAGSVIDHVGFYVRNLTQSIDTWKAAAVNTRTCAPSRCDLTTPDGLVRINIAEKPSLTVPMAFGYVYFRVVDPDRMQAWYARVFGAVPGREGDVASASVPGGTLLFGRADAPTAPSLGRAVNHFGFEVANLEEFYKRSEANGVTFERAFIRRPEMQEDLTSLIDPWGARVELNDGVARW